MIDTVLVTSYLWKSDKFYCNLSQVSVNVGQDCHGLSVPLPQNRRKAFQYVCTYARKIRKPLKALQLIEQSKALNKGVRILLPKNRPIKNVWYPFNITTWSENGEFVFFSYVRILF